MFPTLFFLFILQEEDLFMVNSNQSPLLQKPDYVVCTCMGVMCSEIEDAIDSGYTTFESLSNLLMVGTGCNSCVAQVHEIVAYKKVQNK